MLRVALRDALTKPGRFLRTALAIALGVAFVVGTFVLTDTTSAAFEQAVETQSGDWDLSVRSVAPFEDHLGSTSSREPMPDSIAAEVAAVEGVDQVDPRVIGYAQIVAPDGEPITPMGPPTLGLSFGVADDDDLTAGRAPSGDDEVVVDEATVADHGFAIGDEVQILFVGPARTFTVVGTFEAEAMLGATVAFFELPTAQEVLEKEGVLDTVAVEVVDGADPEAVLLDVEAVLGDGIEVITSEQERDEVSEAWETALGTMRTALLVFAGVALAVGAFQILNTFTILLTQRTRELGLLRALGAGRRQVTGSVVAEAVVVGSLASAAGIALGVLVALGMLALVRGMGIDLPSTATVLEGRTIAIGVAAGLVTTIVSAYLPARRAGMIAPVVAMGGGGPARRGGMARRAALGLVSMAAGVAAIAYGLTDSVSSPLRFVGLGAALVFLGVATLTPLVAAPVAHLVGRPIRSIGGEPGALAEQNAARDPRRTAATASALMIGIGVVGFFAILADSVKVSVVESIDEVLAADLVLTAEGMAEATGFSPEVATQLRAVPEVGDVAEFHIGQMGIDGSAQPVVALDPAATAAVLALSPANEATFAALGGSGLAVHEQVLADRGWGIGDDVNVEFSRTGTVPLEIVGTFAGDGFDDNGYAIGLDTYEANFTDQLESAVYLTYAEGVGTSDGRAAVDEVLADFPNVRSMDPTEVKEFTAQSVDQMLAMVTVLLLFSLVISFVGIANTLALSVVERTRELGLLRAVGMSRRQLKRMIRAEATIVAVLGTGLGAVVAFGLSWAMVQALADDGVSTFHLPWGRLIAIGILAVLAAGLAAGRPARRAAKMPVLTAISGP